MEVLLWISGCIYIILLYELILGWSTKQNRKFYTKLFDAKVYYFSLLISLFLMIKPVYDLIKIKQFTLPILAIPFVYLLLFKIINTVSRKINKRNIIIVGRSDAWPQEHKWYVDSLLHYVATIISIALPIAINLYFSS